MDPKGKAALITGGATGIGRATAMRLAQLGANIAVNYSKSDSDASATVEAIRALGRDAMAVRADVADDGQVRAMVDEVIDHFGRLDILVNSAGFTDYIHFNELEAVTEETWDRTLAVNLKGPFHCMRAAAPHMKAAGEGCMVSVSSIAGRVARGNSIPYCASKAALDVLTRAMARVLAPEIRVNAVAPGVVDTRWVAGQKALLRSAQLQTPLRRAATADDVADAIVSLITACDFITGQVLPVDGGITA